MIIALNFRMVHEMILPYKGVIIWLIMIKKCLIVKGKRGVRKYFEEVGVDMAGEDIMQASEVFDVGDGRYLIVEG